MFNKNDPFLQSIKELATLDNNKEQRLNYVAVFVETPLHQFQSATEALNT